MAHTLAQLAQRFGLELVADGDIGIDGVCTLTPGEPGRVAFLANPRYRSQLAGTRAAAVIVGPKDAPHYAGAKLVARDPYLAFARIAALFDGSREFAPGIHPAAVIAAGVVIPASAHVGAVAVVGAGSVISAGVYLGAGCVVGRGVQIGEGSWIAPRAVLEDGVQLGKRCRVQSGAVIGSRGFGLARGPAGWEEVPQLGSVILGDDVEVGANTTIDRGAIGDTVLADGVKLDNQIQIAHNVQIGAHTAIAACVGIAGSTRIGARCMIGGGAGVAGHLEIGDDVIILGWTMVTHPLREPGQYGSGMPAQPAREWRRTVARVQRLGRLAERLGAVEDKIGITRSRQGDDGDNAG